jgi:diguanylate cyclase (GGDEF)-like protein
MGTPIVTQNQPRPKLLVSSWMLIVFSLLINIGIMSSVDEIYTRTLLLTSLQLFWSMVAAAAVGYAAKCSMIESRRAARAWGFLALGQSVVIVTYLLALGAVLDLGVSNQLIYGSALFIYPLLLVGILSLPATPLTRLAWWKTALDLAIVLFSAVLVLWQLWLRPLMAAAGVESIDAQLFVLAYPVGHLVLFWALLLRLHRGGEGQSSRPIHILALGVALTIISDLHFGYSSVIGAPIEGSWLDLGWALQPLLFGFAGLWQAHTVRPAAPNAVAEPSASSWLRTGLAYLPYLAAITAYFVLELSETTVASRGLTLLSWGVGLIIGLVLLRQIITIEENRQINRKLHIEIGERKRVEAQLAHDAVHDALTGLPNRVLFLDRLHQAIALAKRRAEHRFSLLFLDLDHFKVVNDSLGHAIGDQLLIGIAQRLRLSLRTGDTVARLGGDEFVILLEDTATGSDAITTAERILTTLQQPFNLHGHQLFASASIGIVSAVDSYDQPEEILRDADIAMYQAKTQGKGRAAVFSINMREQAQTRLELENDLHYALARNELELFYQPIMALQSDQITGFEALLRWRHPVRGLVSPNEFIPIAEETGLVIPIGQWVIQQACRQLRTWQRQFPQTPPLTMNINISGAQFADPNFIDRVTTILQDQELDPSTVRFELTESVWLNSTTEAITLFQALSKLGIELHIDDFGTGYSSLAYLQHFPIRTLKIDRVFLHKMDENNHSKDLVRAVVAMAHDLGMETVAEGIETVEQLQQLRQFGCNYGQGYLLSRPITSRAVERLLKASRPVQTTPPQSAESPLFIEATLAARATASA